MFLRLSPTIWTNFLVSSLSRTLSLRLDACGKADVMHNTDSNVNPLSPYVRLLVIGVIVSSFFG